MPANATAPSTWPSFAQMKSWTALEAADAAFDACNVLAQEYIEGTFATWLTQYRGGLVHGPTGLLGDPDAVPPAPPAGAKAQLSVTGLAFDLIQTGPPVCSVPPYQKIPAPQAASGHGGDALAQLQQELGSTPAPSVFTKATAPGQQQTAPDGSVWVRIMAIFAVLLALSAPPARAQVNLRFTPEPMAVPTAQIANARDLGRWVIEGCNDGAAVATIAAERLDMAAGSIRFVDSDDSLLVLTAHTRRGFWGVMAHWGPIVGMAAAAGLNLGGVIKGPAAIALSAGSSVLPTVSTIAQGEVPSVAPLVSSMKYPITLMPGACFTDHKFAAKVKDPQVVMGQIK